MAEWEYIYNGYPNPAASMAIDRIRRQPAVRRARNGVAMPPEQRINELVAAGSSEQQAAEVIGMTRGVVD